MEHTEELVFLGVSVIYFSLEAHKNCDRLFVKLVLEGVSFILWILFCVAFFKHL